MFLIVKFSIRTNVIIIFIMINSIEEIYNQIIIEKIIIIKLIYIKDIKEMI